jgi:hypothetical protein
MIEQSVSTDWESNQTSASPHSTVRVTDLAVTVGFCELIGSAVPALSAQLPLRPEFVFCEFQVWQLRQFFE